MWPLIQPLIKPAIISFSVGSFTAVGYAMDILGQIPTHANMVDSQIDQYTKIPIGWFVAGVVPVIIGTWKLSQILQKLVDNDKQLNIKLDSVIRSNNKTSAQVNNLQSSFARVDCLKYQQNNEECPHCAQDFEPESHLDLDIDNH